MPITAEKIMELVCTQAEKCWHHCEISTTALRVAMKK